MLLISLRLQATFRASLLKRVPRLTPWMLCGSYRRQYDELVQRRGRMEYPKSEFPGKDDKLVTSDRPDRDSTNASGASWSPSLLPWVLNFDPWSNFGVTASLETIRARTTEQASHPYEFAAMCGCQRSHTGDIPLFHHFQLPYGQVAPHKTNLVKFKRSLALRDILAFAAHPKG